MNDLLRNAELVKLGAVLGIDPHEVSYLAALPSASLRSFRDQVNDMLFATDRKPLIGVARAAELIPTRILVGLVPKLVPPHLAARLAGLVDVQKAIKLASGLPVTYLADVVPSLDPRRAIPILAQIPQQVVRPVAATLQDRADYVTMGRLVAFITDESVATALEVLNDTTVLHLAALAEDPDRLSHIVMTLPDERINSIVQQGETGQRWVEILLLVSLVSPSARERVWDYVQHHGFDAELERTAKELGVAL